MRQSWIDNNSTNRNERSLYGCISLMATKRSRFHQLNRAKYRSTFPADHAVADKAATKTPEEQGRARLRQSSCSREKESRCCRTQKERVMKASCENSTAPRQRARPALRTLRVRQSPAHATTKVRPHRLPRSEWPSDKSACVPFARKRRRRSTDPSAHREKEAAPLAGPHKPTASAKPRDQRDWPIAVRPRRRPPN